MTVEAPAVLSLARKRLIAFQRFGLGARAGTFKSLADPKKALLAELKSSNARIPKTAVLPTYAQACAGGETGKAIAGYPKPATANDLSMLIMRRELDARHSKHLAARIGFLERLVIFWANHFTVNANKEVRTLVRATVGQLERDVIRRHVLGKFPDMLVAVMKHPAMICYLDNHISVGPNSESAKNGNPFDDVNVNLAREIHELHTVGSGGGYTEADIRELALAISGWTIVTESDTGPNRPYPPEMAGQFVFKPSWHEPPSSRPTFLHMGKVRPNVGTSTATGEAILRFLALRRDTAEHLAYKMIAHFLTDRPTAKQVDALADVYMKTGGSLKAMAVKLLSLPGAWSWPVKKFRTPYETTVAQYRALRVRHTDYVKLDNGSDGSNYQTTRHNLMFLNQLTWECLDPDGWDDDSAEWLNPDALRVRIAAAYASVKTYAPDVVRVSGTAGYVLASRSGIIALGKSILGSHLSKSTQAAIRAAPDADRALAVLFVSPEFQRR
jgi:uncharacterized protein (DUF1800 family)